MKGEARPAVAISVDAAWSKGAKTFDSHTAIAAARQQTPKGAGKILEYQTRVRACRTCSVNVKKNPNITQEEYAAYAKKHDCAKNWSGTSGAMESDMIVGLVADLDRHGLAVQHMVLDDDSTTVANLMEGSDTLKVEPHLALKANQFKADPNHRMKAISNNLYKTFTKAGTVRIGYLLKGLR